MRVVFYVSGHGFGHASRDIELMRALLALRPDARLSVRAAIAPAARRRSSAASAPIS